MKGRFVGRERPLMLLHDALRDVRAGHARTVYVHGTSGVGKTALTNTFSATSLTARWCCRAAATREAVPYKVLDSVMDELGVRLASMPDAAALLHDDVGHLARLFPVLTKVTAVSSWRPARRSLLKCGKWGAAQRAPYLLCGGWPAATCW